MDQMVSDSNCCVGRQPGIFDHRLGEICFSLGHANRRAHCVPATQSTFKSDAGTIPGCNCHSFAYTEGNTHSYPQRYAFPKPSPYTSASPASTPSPIASLSFAFLAALRSCLSLKSNGSQAFAIETYECKGDFED